jgi:putative hydrolase of the HAD superfamily
MRNISRAGRAEFYQPNLPKNLEPIPGSHQLLEKLKSQYTLFLVTAGHIPTQLKKIELLKISNYFSEIRYVDPQKGETKYQTFVEIKNDSHIDTQRILCVGNRLDNEIQAANRLGFDTCFVRFGEHRHQKPIQEMEKPSFIIDHISQIEEICGL